MVSDDEVDAELRHLGITFTGTTRRFEHNKMIINHYDRVRRICAEQQQIFAKEQDKSRRISDELINDLSRLSLVPIKDIKGSVSLVHDLMLS